MNIGESIKLALDSIRVNKLRASLTLLSISIGVFAIVVAGSLVESINGTVRIEMEKLGDNLFYIMKSPKIVTSGSDWRKYDKRKDISYRQCKLFKEKMSGIADISYANTQMGYKVKYRDYETNPDVVVVGVDENFSRMLNYGVEFGRTLTQIDMELGSNNCLIGNDIVQMLFKNEDPMGKEIIIKQTKFKIVGILNTRGAMMGRSQDNVVLIALPQLLRNFTLEWRTSLEIYVKAQNKEVFDATMDEAIGTLRILRNLKPWEENDFNIETNESIANQFEGLISFLVIFAGICGGIAMVAAGVGIMNIMLVTVKERTREIGIRKAIGAKKGWILTQFLIETITIAQIGGWIGIIGGFAVSALFSKLLDLTIIVPLNWVLISLGLCTFLGLVFGIYPAWKAANLDPIEALRYE